MKSQNLSYRLKIIFGLFFIFPIMGFVYIGTLSGLLSKNYTLYYLLGVLVFSYLGFVMLKRIFDDIGNLSSKISSGDLASLKDSVSASSTAEMQSLVHSFTTIENQFQQSSLELAKRATELATLRELSDLCYMTFDPNEILYITLERSLLLTHSDLGSVMILEGADRKIFVVKATLGHGDIVRIDDEIDFETSIAKYAVINKSPLVVEDIEKDSRFGRANLDHYGTKSFICMPIKTSQSIIGVLTISRREEGRKYDLRDVESLTPLISNAAFTYENIRLIEENKRFARYPRAIEKLFKILNSSIQDRELLTAILTEMHNIAPFQYALVMLRDDSEPDQLSIFDLITSEPIKLARGNSYLMTDTLLDRVVRQDSTVEITHTDSLTSPVERELFVDQNASSCTLAPLRIGQKVTGVLALCLQNRDILYDVSDLMPWLANVISFTLERNKLVSAMARRTQETDAIRQNEDPDIDQRRHQGVHTTDSEDRATKNRIAAKQFLRSHGRHCFQTQWYR